MNDLRDTRQHVGRTVTDGSGNKGSYALAASEAVFELLSGNPNVEITTIRLHVENENPPRVTASGRVGSLVGAAGDPGELTYVEPLPGSESVAWAPRFEVVQSECPSCHQLTGRPPTDYCQQPTNHPLAAGNQA